MEEIQNSTGSQIKVILDDIKFVIGLKSITFFLDNVPLKPIALGSSEVFTVASGPHKIETVLKAGSIFTGFINFSRKSKPLSFTSSLNAITTIRAKYNRTWGNIELEILS